MKKKVNYKYLIFLLIAISLASRNDIKNISEYVENNEEKEEDIKVICKFLNISLLEDNDIITFLNEDNTIYEIIDVNKNTTYNNTYIYLPKGKYKIIGNRLKDNIDLTEKNTTYVINFDYKKEEIETSKIIDDNIIILNKNNNMNNMFLENEQEEDIINVNYQDIVDDGYIPQGYTIIKKEKIALISSYKENKKSRIYIYKNNHKYLGYIILENKNHVGGITYDDKNDILFLTAVNGKFTTYKLKPLLTALKNAKKETEGIVIIDLNNRRGENNNTLIIENDINTYQSASTLTYYDNSIYSIDYGLNGVIVKTNYEYLDNEIVELKNEFFLPENARCIQGICFYKKDNDLYLITSSSSGILKSKITSYKFKDVGFEKVGEKILKDKKLEGIAIINNNKISFISEGELTISKDIEDIDNLLNSKEENRLNDILYSISGAMWDLRYSRGLAVNDVKKLTKK